MRALYGAAQMFEAQRCVFAVGIKPAVFDLFAGDCSNARWCNVAKDASVAVFIQAGNGRDEAFSCDLNCLIGPAGETHNVDVQQQPGTFQDSGKVLLPKLCNRRSRLLSGLPCRRRWE